MNPRVVYLSRLLVVLVSALVITSSSANAQATAPSNSVLNSMSGKLTGNHKFIRWSNISSANSSKFAWSSSTFVPAYTAPGTLFSLEPIAPGYRATEGFYSYTSDFGFKAVIAPTAAVSSSYGIKVLTLQAASMLNWPGGWTLENYFNYDHADHFDENSSNTGDMADYYGNVTLLALHLTDPDDGPYHGGPLLKYTTVEGSTGYLHATSYALLNNGVRMDSLGGTGEWSGTYYSFAWQWDLTTVVGTISRVEITSPLIVHSSTIGVQIDVSDTFTDALNQFAPPPPSQLVATPGDGAVLLTWQARTGATSYLVKRSLADGGPYAVVGTLASAETSFRDTGLSNGTPYYYVVSAANTTGGEGVNSAQRSATPAVPAISAWRQTHFGFSTNSGEGTDAVDADGDGLSNIFEYALGLDPQLPDAVGKVVLGTTTTGSRKLTLTFNRIADPTLVYTVEATDDLASGNWERIYFSTLLGDPLNYDYAYGTSGVNTINGNVAGPVTVTDNVIISAKSRRFLRLTVSNAESISHDAPRGFQSVDLSTGTSSLGFPLLNEPVVAAKVSAVSGNSLTLNNSALHVGGLLASQSLSPFYVEVISGPLVGERIDVDVAATINAAGATVVLSPTSTRNTVPSASWPWLAGNSIVLRKHVTLTQIQSLFGTALSGSDTAGSADSIYVFANGAFTQYYLRADGLTWRRTALLTDQRYLAIAPGEGVQVRLQNAKLLKQTGAVRTHAFRRNLAVGLQIAANPWPVDLSPARIGAAVNTSQDAAIRWTGSNTSSAADSLYVFSDGVFTQHYLRADGAAWRRTSGLTNYAATKILKATDAYLIRRNQADPTWTLQP